MITIRNLVKIILIYLLNHFKIFNSVNKIIYMINFLKQNFLIIIIQYYFLRTLEGNIELIIHYK